METSAASGQNVALAVETLLGMVMNRMEEAVDRAMLPGRRGRPNGIHDEADYAEPPVDYKCNAC